MKKLNSFIIFSILLLFQFSREIRAQGTTGAQFLNIGVGSRACAMGDSYGAIANDASAIYWNPAGLTQLSSANFMVSQNFWLLDMSAKQFAGGFPTKFGHFGLGILYFSSGSIPKIENFLKVGEYTAYDLSFDVAYAYELWHSLSFGISGSYISQKIENFNATTYAFNVGLMYRLQKYPALQFGIILRNAGPAIKFIQQSDPLPLSFKIGGSYLGKTITLSTEIDKTLDNDIQYALGGEYLFNKILALRAGYNSLLSFTFGFGIIWEKLELSYAYLPNIKIDHAHIISIRFLLARNREIPGGI